MIPSLFDNIVGFGGRGAEEDGQVVAAIGGLWRQPRVSFGYLLAARLLLAESGREGCVDATALPIAYLQRHALEVALKEVVVRANAVFRERVWLKALAADPSASAPAEKPEPYGHAFVPLLGTVRDALAAVQMSLPTNLEQMALRLEKAENSDPTRFRYLTNTSGERHFPKSQPLPLGNVQTDLEALFNEHLRLQDRDEPEPNLVTTLAIEGEILWHELYALGKS